MSATLLAVELLLFEWEAALARAVGDRLRDGGRGPSPAAGAECADGG